jgi:hypothetical protein
MAKIIVAYIIQKFSNFIFVPSFFYILYSKQFFLFVLHIKTNEDENVFPFSRSMVFMVCIKVMMYTQKIKLAKKEWALFYQ